MLRHFPIFHLLDRLQNLVNTMWLKLICCSLALLWSKVAAQNGTTLNGTYRGPKDFVENQCGVIQENKKGPVVIRFTYFNYCKMTASEKDQVEASFGTLRTKANSLVHEAASDFQWDVQVQFDVPEGESCSLPTTTQNSVAQDGSPVAVHGAPTVIQVNILYPVFGKPDAHTVTWDMTDAIKKELVHTGAAGMLTISFMGPYSSYIKLGLDYTYDSTVYPFFELPDLEAAENVNVGHVLSTVGCNPSYIGAVPFEEYNSNTKSMDCQCVCPQGHAFEEESKGVKICKPIKDFDQSGQCNWLGKCYKVSLTGSTTNSYNGGCTLNGYFGKGIAEVPTPWDNYVFGKTNQPGEGAEIKVTLTGPNSEFTEKIYKWKEFEKNGDQEMNKDFSFITVGVHTLKISAMDYSQDSACETEIMVNDDMLPTVPAEITCPNKFEVSGKAPTYSDDFQKAIDIATLYKGYVSARINDPCGNGESCDIETNKIHSFNGDDEAIIGALEWVLNDDDRAYLHEISSSMLQETPGAPMDKCMSLSSQFGEKVTNYACNSPLSTTCVYSPITCALKQCVSAVGSDMYASAISIKNNVQQRTIAINNMLLNPVYDPAHEIHETVAETSVGTDEGEGTYKAYLSEMILIKHDFTSLSEDPRILFNNPGTDKSIHDVVQSRYSINGGGWVHWELGTSKNMVDFAQESNEIVIETWSKLGRIKTTTFSVIIHPHSPLDMCEQFERTSFYQSLAVGQRDSRHEYCTYPQSDFAEITFDFNHNVGLEPLDAHHLPYHFQNITCTAYYVSEKGSDGEAERVSTGAQLLQLSGDKLKFVRRYGIELRTKPTTESSPVEMDCFLWYKSEEQQEVQQHCQQTLTFSDCEAPHFPEKQVSASLKTCTDGCEDKLQPYSYCGDNRLHYKKVPDLVAEIGEAIFTAESELEDKCCTTCGAYQCVDLVKVEFNSTLKSCQILSSEDAVLLSGASTFESTAFTGFFIAIAIATVAIIMVARKSKSQTADPEGYEPLL